MMDKDIEERMTEFMRPLFGDMARRTIESQKAKLDLEGKELGAEDYAAVADSIRDLCRKMAGNGIAERIHTGLMDILAEEYPNS